MAASHKKVVVRKLNQEWMRGYLPASPPAHTGEVGLLDFSGKVTSVRLAEIKWICYVREFNLNESEQPERLLRKRFLARPRTEGLWIRMHLKDNDWLEGLAVNDASLLDGDGLYLIPPDTRSNTQRVFVPRQAVVSLEIVAVVRAGAGKRPPSAEPAQESLFRDPS